MSLWWLEPGWKSATCMCCGANIWGTGGDPDWGRCLGCMTEHVESDQGYPEPECDICGKAGACADANGYGVCSEACQDEAFKRPTKETP